MGDLIKKIQLAGKMLEIRDTQRGLASYGDKPWPDAVRPFMDAMQKKHDATGEPILDIAARAVKNATAKHNGYVALAFVAAAVELLDPTEAT